MRKFRWLILVVAVFALAYLGAVWGSGWKAQQRYEEQMSAFSAWLQANAPELKVTQQNYERGFFSARAHVRLEYNGAPQMLPMRLMCYWVDDVATPEMYKAAFNGTQDSLPDILQPGHCRENLEEGWETSVGASDAQTRPVHVQLDIENHVQHGPWLGQTQIGIAAVQTQLKLVSDDVPDAVKRYVEALDIHTVRSYSDDFDLRVKAPAVSESLDGSSARLEMQGMDIRLAFYDDRRLMDATLELPLIKMTVVEGGGERTALLFQGGRIVNEGKSTRGLLDWLMSGRTTLDVEHLEVVDPYEGAFENFWHLNNMHLAVENQVQQGLQGQTVRAGFDMKYVGPNGVLLRRPVGVQAEVIGERWDMQTVHAIDEFMTEQSKFGNGLDEIWRIPSLRQTLESQIRQLIAPGPRFKASYSITVGGMEAFAISLDGDVLAAEAGDDKMDLFLLLLGKSSLRMTVAIDQNLALSGIPEWGIDSPLNMYQLRRMVDEGTLQHQGNQYRLNLIYQRGHAQINDKPIGRND